MIDIKNIKVIIMADSSGGFGGGANRWNNYLGVKKHMAPIGNIPVIHYLQKKLKLYGFKDINISCLEEDKDLYILKDVKWIKAPDVSNLINPYHDILICKNMFDKTKNNIILFGDNFYSDLFFTKIINADPNKWWQYGRDGKSKYLNKPYTEGFGWYIPGHLVDFLIKVSEEASEWMINNHGSIVAGVAIHQTHEFALKHEGESDWFSHLIHVDDETTDFDYPEEWDFWNANILPKIINNINP